MTSDRIRIVQKDFMEKSQNMIFDSELQSLAVAPSSRTFHVLTQKE